jgi:hypothetical protein
MDMSPTVFGIVWIGRRQSLRDSARLLRRSGCTLLITSFE